MRYTDNGRARAMLYRCMLKLAPAARKVVLEHVYSVCYDAVLLYVVMLFEVEGKVSSSAIPAFTLRGSLKLEAISKGGGRTSEYMAVVDGVNTWQNADQKRGLCPK